MDFLTEKDLNPEKYGNNLFILAYDAARNKLSRSIAEKFKMDAGTSLESVRAQFHDFLSLPFITDGMLDMVREQLNEEAGRHRGGKNANTTGTKGSLRLVSGDYYFMAATFLFVYVISWSILAALAWTGVMAIIAVVTNKYLDASKNIPATGASKNANTTFSELCSYGAELIEAHLRYTDSPERPLS